MRTTRSNTETVTRSPDAHGWPGIWGRSIHWHAEPADQIEYVATGADQQTIPYVKATDAKGNVKEYAPRIRQNRRLPAGLAESMDCVDCHNAVGHPISPTPQKAIDRAIASGAVSRQLPFVRREGARLLTALVLERRRRHRRNRSRPERLLRITWRQRGSTGRRSCRRRASGRLPAQRVPDDEGDLRRATLTTKCTSTHLDACAVMTTSTRPKMARRSAATASSVTSRRNRSSGLGLGTRRSGFGARENSELRSSASRGPTRAVDGRSIRLIRQSRQSRRERKPP